MQRDESSVFTEAELRQLLFCASEELRARAAGKLPGLQPWLRNLVRRLEIEVAVSSTRQPRETHPQDSEHEIWIGSRLTAKILGWDLRKVQRHTSDFEGRKIGARWIFPEQAVLDYAEALTDG